MEDEKMVCNVFKFTTTNCKTSDGAFVTSGTGQSLFGEIHKVVFRSTSWANGSVFLIDKTTNETIYGAGNVSGTIPVVYYPRPYASTTGGVSLSGANGDGGHNKVFIVGPVIASGLGLGSATAGTIGEIEVYYQG